MTEYIVCEFRAVILHEYTFMKIQILRNEMNYHLIFVLFLLVIFLILFIYKFIQIYHQKKYLKTQQLVKETSLRYNSILSLNRNYHFHNIRPCYVYTKQVNSKAQLYHFNFDN